MSMNKRLILWSSLGALVIAAVWFFLEGRSAPKYDFRFDTVSTGDLSAYVTATGTINPVVSVDVGTQVSGIISRLYADFNSVVKKGQIIAQIDPTFLQQAVKDAQAGVEKAKAQLEDSKRTYDREKALFDKGLESQLNYDAALTTYQTNQAALKSAQAAFDRAKINLAYATIYAPIDGVVINRAVNVGQTVAASFSSPTLFTIANDLKKMQVQTTVDESDIGRISIGQEVSFTVDAYTDDKFTGVVAQIRLAPVNVQNVINYTVVINVDNKDLKLMPGMTANVRVLVSNAANVLRVPNMALRLQPPAELIDSVKILQMRESFGMRGGPGGDSTRNGMGAGGPGSEERRQRFQAVRDSIQKAHGGSMDRDELMAEVFKVMGGPGRFGGRAEREQQPAAQQLPTAKTAGKSTDNNKFGIIQLYPEFQKSGYVVSHQSGRARVWIMNAAGKLEPVFVRTGITDGKYTEVSSQTLKSGDQIVLGVTSNDGAADQGRSPLTDQGNRMRGPGGPGGMR
ncbi:MAG TPA: efflux RND transporter periplasmic adaptor subunit [Bacteroidota bacterium]